MSRQDQDNKAARAAIPVSVIIAACLVVSVAGIALASEFALIERMLAKRLVALAFGGLLLTMGNFLPKIALPLVARGRDPGRVIAAERFAGWILVLGGMGAITACLLLPADRVLLAEAAIGLVAFGLVAARWMLLIRSGAAPGLAEMAPDTTVDQAPQKTRLGVFMILHALLWVFVIFVIDALWGDSAAQWTAVIFVLANGVLATVFFPNLIKRARASN